MLYKEQRIQQSLQYQLSPKSSGSSMSKHSVWYHWPQLSQPTQSTSSSTNLRPSPMPTWRFSSVPVQTLHAFSSVFKGTIGFRLGGYRPTVFPRRVTRSVLALLLHMSTSTALLLPISLLLLCYDVQLLTCARGIEDFEAMTHAISNFNV